MTGENPYSAPETDSTATVDKNSREHLRKVASGQRNVLYAMLFQICILVANVVFGQLKSDIVPILGILILILLLANMVFIVLSVFRLAASLDGVVLALLWILFSIVPCLGLLFLFILSQRATNLLTKNGIKVGFLGADPSSI